MTATPRTVQSPYKGLSPFDDTELDALLFFGREHETGIVVANALASRLTVLYGPSGVGKSSLLRAGVAHTLRGLAESERLAVAYYSTWSDDPAGGVEDAARTALADALGGDPGDAPGDLADRLEAWTAALGGELLLVLDQFEELFLYHSDGGTFDVLPELVTRPGLRVNVVLGIRDDELARLDAFKARIPGLFSNYLRLDLLDREAARAAILGPLARYNELEGAQVSIEPALVEAILEQVAAGRIDSGIVGRGTVGEEDERPRIETPYLQLVLQRLWEVSRAEGSSTLRLDQFAALGGAQQIVEDHLERAMAALSPPEQDVAAGMFEHLVTPSGAKIAHGASDLASFAQVDAAAVEPVLRSLARERILRPTGEDAHTGGRYEIYHDVLAGAVLAWRTRHEAQTALARERVAAKRHQRRLAVVAAASAAALALMAILTVYAYAQRSTARDQAAAARVQRSKAEREQAKAVTAAATATAATKQAVQARNEANAASARNKQIAAAERRQRNRADAQARELARKNAQLDQAAKRLRQSNAALGAAKARSDLNAAAAQRATRIAQARTREALAAKRVAQAGALLQRALAEVDTDPVQSVADALAATGTASLAGAEDVLRSSLLATHLLAKLPAGGPAADVAYSEDGSRAAVVGAADGVRIYSTATGRLVAALPGKGPFSSVAFSPAGGMVAAGGKGGTVDVWSLASKSVTHTLRQGAPVVSVAFSADGRLLATAGGKTTKLWDAAGGSLLHTLAHDRAMRSASFSRDGRLLLTVSNDTAARVWDIASGKLISTLSQRGEVTSAAFGPDSRLVVTGSRDQTAAIWDARTGTQQATLTGHTGQVLAVAFSPAGDRVATGSTDGSTRIWSVSGDLLDVIRASRASVVSLAFSPDGQSVVAASSDGTASTFGPAQATIHLAGEDGPMRRAAFSPDGSTVATIAGDSASLWEPYGEPRLHGIHVGPAAATAVAFDPTGRLLASGGADGNVVVQRAHGGPLRTLAAGSPVLGLTWARNGLLLIAEKDGTLDLHPGGGTSGWKLAHGSPLVAGALSADGTTAASAGTDGLIQVWDTATGKRLAGIKPAGTPTAVALDPAGRLLAAGVEKSVVLYDARSGRRLGSLDGHTDTVTGVAFSADGTQLASSSRDHDARVWDPRTLKLVKVLHGHSSFVSGVAFSPDGRWIATAGPLKAGVWAAHATDLPGSFLFFVRGNVSPIAAVAFSSSGWELATAARDGSIRVIDCTLCGRLAQLEATAHRLLQSLKR